MEKVNSENTNYRDPEKVKEAARKVMRGSFSKMNFQKTPQWMRAPIDSYIGKVILAIKNQRQPLGMFFQGPSHAGKTYSIFHLVCKLLYDTRLGFSERNMTYSRASDVIRDLGFLETQSKSFNPKMNEAQTDSINTRLFPEILDVETQAQYDNERRAVVLKTIRARPVVIIDDLNTLKINDIETMADYIDTLIMKDVIIFGATNIDEKTKKEQMANNEWQRLWNRINNSCYLVSAPVNAPIFNTKGE